MIAPAERADAIRRALERGRSGSATLSELATAYDLSCLPELAGCNNELRLLMLDKLRPDSTSVRRDVAVGVVSGALTHLLLGGL
jgi:hypothetical protein